MSFPTPNKLTNYCYEESTNICSVHFTAVYPDSISFWAKNKSFGASSALSTIVEDEQLHSRETEAAGT